jgi:vacuolar-type H+-ATPase subunit B/Vma2
MRVEKFILAIKGYVNPEKEKATVFLSQDITNIKHSDKVDMITNLYFLPTVGSIVKNRMGSTLAHYFGVQKETEA